MTQEALKLALEALEGFYEYGYDRQECFEHITAIKEALAQPVQEPVVYDIASILACRDMLDAQPVPPRTWVGLTDEERKDIELGIEVFGTSVEDILKEAEAKLKQKNGYVEEKNT